MEQKTDKKIQKSRSSAGQVVKRGKTFQIRIYLGCDSVGKRHYFNETFRGTSKDADKRKRELLAEHEHGEPLTMSKNTLNAFLDEWLKAPGKKLAIF